MYERDSRNAVLAEGQVQQQVDGAGADAGNTGVDG